MDADVTDPDVDDDDLVAAVRVLGRVARVIGRIEAGLTPPQFRILSLLAAGDERSTTLASHLAVSKPTISSAVDALVERGLLQRRLDHADRRVTWLQLTPSGSRALDAAERAYLDRLGPMLRRLSDPRQFVAGVIELGTVLDSERAERFERAEPRQGRASEVGR